MGRAIKMRSHTFRGERFDVTFTEDIDGLCVAQHNRRGEVLLFTERPPKVFLETALHEALHAMNWSIPEAVIKERAAELARWLWRLGYRRQQ